jgi:hypothetical protein
MSKGGSKVLTGVIAFILGFVFAIVFEVAAIFGLGYYALNTDLDVIFNMVGFTNKDSNGDAYINTDESTGGSKNVMALVTKLQEVVNGIGAYTLGDLEEIFPALDGLTSGIFNSLNDYVEISVEEIKQEQFMDLPTYIENKVYAIKPAALMKQFGAEEALNSNEILKALLEGVEADYVIDADGTKYPVYYDEYRQVEENGNTVYRRTTIAAGTDVYPSNLTTRADYWLVDMGKKDSDGNELYRQYFYKCGDNYFVTKKVDGTYVNGRTLNNKGEYDEAYYSAYAIDGMGNPDEDGKLTTTARLTGNYYYEGEEQVFISPITLESLSTDPLAPLDSYLLTNLFEGQELIEKVFGETSLGDLINNRVDFENLINSVELSTLLDISPTNKIMAYLGYQLNGVTAVKGQSYQYTGTRELDDGTKVTCYIETTTKNDEEIISRVYYIEDKLEHDVACCTVEKITDVIGDITKMEITAILDISPTNKVMAYLGYQLNGVSAVESQSYGYTGTRELDDGTTVTCYIETTTKDGEEIISRVYYLEDGKQVEIQCCTVDGITDVVGNIKKMEINSIMDISPTNKVMAYLGYQLNGITSVANQSYGYTGTRELDDGTTVICYIETKTENGSEYIKRVYYIDGGKQVEINCCTVGGIENVVGDIDKMEITAILDISPTNKVMTYLGYKLSNIEAVTESGKTYQYTATYELDDGTIANCYIETATEDSEEIIKRVYYMDGNNQVEIKCSTVAGIVDVVGEIDKIELSTIMDISPTNKIMAYLGYKVSNVAEVTESGKTYQYTASYELADGSLVDCYIEAKTDDGAEIISKVYYYNDDNQKVNVSCSKVKDVADIINDIKVTSIISIEASDKIMTYLGYGVFNLEAVEGNDNTFTGNISLTDDTSDKESYRQVTVVTNSEGVIIKVYYEENDQTINVTGTTINELSKRVGGITKSLKIKDVIDITDESSNFMKKLGDYYIADVGNAVDVLTVSDFITPTPSEALLMYVTYGVSGITDISENKDGTLYSAKLWSKDEDGNDIYEVIYIKVTVNSNDEEELYFYKLVEDEEVELTDLGTTINGINNVVNNLTARMTLDEIVHIDSSNTFLYAVRNSTIAQIPSSIANLSLQSVFTKDIYGITEEVYEPEKQTTYNSAYLYYIKNDDGTYTLVHDDEENSSRGKLTKEEFDVGVDAGVYYYSYGKPTGAWWFMLSVDKSELVYTVNDMGKLMSNVTSNILTASLSEMRDAGLITAQINSAVPFAKETKADGTIVYYIRYVDNCTVDGLINSIQYMTDSDYAYALINNNLIDTYIDTKTGETELEKAEQENS